MPTIPYKPPLLIRGAHLETLYPHFFRRVKSANYESLIIDTPDDDFLEAESYHNGGQALIILSHGLEGSSRRDYMLGMVNIFLENDYDVLTWNYRGCGEKLNRQPRLYHSGATDDLDTMVNYAKLLGYEKIALIGFSLGGNLTLKYCGEQGEKIAPEIKAAMAISVPLDLDAGCTQLTRPGNFLYSYRFVSKLKKKVKLKQAQYPELIDLTGISDIKDLRTFDDRYTAPFHGFSSAEDYYAKCSSKQFLKDIKVPTLILNAKNDPFLPEECYLKPGEINNEHIKFEAPNHGGHVGFTWFSSNGTYWSEIRAYDFMASVLN